MSNLEITLDEFVTKIPLCQVNAGWENIVKALNSSSRDLIAIVDSNFCPQGILKSHHLLAAIANNRRNSGIGVQKSSKLLSAKRSLLPTEQLKTLLLPITALSCEIKVSDFILLLNDQVSLISEQNYLIVDQTGKVQGILDIPKLIQHVTQGDINTGHKSDEQQSKVAQQSFSEHLKEICLAEREISATLLEPIPLPRVVNDAPGNIRYQTAPSTITKNSTEQEINHNSALVTEVGMHSLLDLNKLRRLQTEFTVNISHDLKSPLTAIIGLSSLLRAEKLGSLNFRQIRYLDLIYRSGRQLRGMVTDLLDITSLATGKLRLKLETIELEKFCHQVSQEIIAKLEAVHDPRKNQPLVLPQLQFNLDSDSSLVIADRLRLNQILTRLLENAVKSTSEAGAIGIRIERWAEWVAIIVWDTGRGISEAFQPSLLEEMFEPDNFLSSPEKMTSSGLILAQQLAQSHGGDISFKSQINRGSEFTLLLPANPLKIKNQEGCSLEAELSANKKYQSQSTLVLIVETSPVRIQDLTENLKKLGYHTAIAHNQNEALYKASHLQPSKIILNQQLIELTDRDLLLKLKSNPQTSKIPLLLIKSKPSAFSRGRVPSTDKDFPRPEYLYFQTDDLFLSPDSKSNLEVLTKYFPPLTNQDSSQHYCQGKRLTMLRLCLSNEKPSSIGSEIDFLFDDPSVNLCHHIIEADSIEQANMLARIWKIDTIIWDSSNLALSLDSLRSLETFPHLPQIPIVTLDEPTTAAANQLDNLNIFPCLVPINEQNITELMQVIQSAATAFDN